MREKVQWRFAVVLMGFICVAARGQFATTLPAVAAETQARGYWISSATGLMWASHDSSARMGWHKATKFCRKLQVAGYMDWRLPTIEELESLVNLSAYETEHIGSSDILHWNGDLQVNGGLVLTGDRHWSSSPAEKAGMPRVKFWSFDFRTGRRREGFEDIMEGDTMHALCVRDVQRSSAPTKP